MIATAHRVLDRAAGFLYSHARLLERRLFDLQFDGGSSDAAAAAVLAYQNPDGGFGHALEPDLRVSSSQPIFSFFGLCALRTTGADVAVAVRRVCSWLAQVAHVDGSLAYVLHDALEHDRASHWNGPYALAPSLNATAGIAGALHALGAESAWLDRATTWCIAQVEGSPAYTGHTILNTLDFLHAVKRPDLVERVTRRLFEADYVLLATPVETYGLTPLRFAPAPHAPLRPLFEDAVIEAHLDDLLSRQREDGGWPVTWNPPHGAAANEWRGRWTLDALEVLRAYGRI